MENLNNRIGVVTGGAQGIGLGIARALKAEGAKPVLVDVDEEALATAGKELNAATYVLDVRDRQQYEQVVSDIEETHGPIDILCNNAGVGGGASVTAMTYEMWDWVLDVNVGGVVNGFQTVVPRMLQRQSGHIVSTASGAGLIAAGVGGFMYATSKFAVVGLSEGIRDDLGKRGIGVSVLCPGPVATDIMYHTESNRPDHRHLNAGQQKELDRLESWLHTKGTPPDEVGRMVVDGIKRNALYIHTDRWVEQQLRERTENIIAAMPPHR